MLLSKSPDLNLWSNCPQLVQTNNHLTYHFHAPKQTIYLTTKLHVQKLTKLYNLNYK